MQRRENAFKLILLVHDGNRQLLTDLYVPETGSGPTYMGVNMKEFAPLGGSAHR